MKVAFLTFTFLVTIQAVGQSPFPISHFITDSLVGLPHVLCIDMDMDGDLDVIASQNLYGVCLKNTSGDGFFGSRYSFQTAVGFPLMYPSDLDGDHDWDFLLSEDGVEPFYFGSVRWLNNVNGHAIYTGGILTEDIFLPEEVQTADMDADGDQDVLYIEGLNSRIFMHENDINGSGVMGTYQEIESVYGAGKMVAFDIDDDDDSDIAIVCGSSNPILRIFRNELVLGEVQLVVSQEIPLQNKNLYDMYSLDFDNDGDLDLLSAYFYEGELVWWENMDGLGTFSSEQLLLTHSTRLRVKAGDFEGDDDIDILLDSDIGMFYAENLGGTTYNQPIYVGASCYSRWHDIGDMDRDGDLDLLIYKDGILEWWENTTILSLEESTNAEFLVFPNPVIDELSVHFSKKVHGRFQLTSSAGALLQSGDLLGEDHTQVDMSELESGIYFFHVISENGNSVKRIVK